MRKIVFKDRKTGKITQEIDIITSTRKPKLTTLASILADEVEIQNEVGEVIGKYDALPDVILTLIE